MEKRWVLKEQGDKKHIQHLAQVLKIDPSLANLLAQRGITTFEEARAFFRPSLEDLHDPFLMKDMDKAVSRIEKAIDQGEKILVFGDYDVDGTSAVALVYLFLKTFTSNIDFYLPDRYTEGYGISTKSIDYAAQSGFSLIIALDCGIKAVEKIAYAKSKHIDYIIADHHRPGETVPEAVAVLDPKRTDCTYPFNELSGCGVGFKLVQAIALKRRVPFSDLHKYLDLVVVSIASDIVQITGENRILAYYGLQLINSNPRPGIEAILKYSGINRKYPGQMHLDDSRHRDDCIFGKKLTISDLVFVIGPRINAAGRIENARNSVNLLIAEDIESAEDYARQVDDFNTERKSLDANTTLEALEMIRNDRKLSDARTTVLYNPRWHKGVIGIVASRLIENYYRPTIVLTQSNGLITGSARSIKDFDIYAAVDACSDLLEHFGGHKYAAGLSFRTEKLEVFKRRFEDYVTTNLGDVLVTPEVEIDEELCLSAINKKFVSILKQFAPFGPGNMSPLFRTNQVKDTGSARKVGQNHLKLEVFHPHVNSFPISAIAFQQAEHLDLINKNLPFNICYHIEENEWNNNVTIQLNIKDIKPVDDYYP